MRSLLLGLWGLALCAAVPAAAQYYEEEELPSPGNRFLTAGAMWRVFEPRESLARPDSAAIRFDRVMPLAAYRQGQMEIYFGYTTFGVGNNRTAVVLGTTIATDVPLTRTPASSLVLPIILAADYAKASAGGLQRDDFNIASIGIGTGLSYRWTSPRTIIWVQGAQIIHLAFEGFMGRSGSSSATVAEAGLCLRGFGIGDGLVATYRFRRQIWGVSGSLFDYRSTFHGPSIGILF